MKLFSSLTLLLLPWYSHAGVVCEPIGNISQRVNYCDENSAYVEPGRNCLKTYKALVDAENAKIQKVLNAQVKNASGTQQSVDFKTTEKVLADADAALTRLITQGRQVLSEFEAYTEDMVLPIYDAYPEDYELDPHSAEGQKVFREKECYGEPMEDFDGFKHDVKSILSDLEKTKAKTIALHGLSSHKESDLGALNPNDTLVKGTGNGGSPKAVPKGPGKKGSSTITGVEESKKKEKKQQ